MKITILSAFLLLGLTSIVAPTNVVQESKPTAVSVSDVTPLEIASERNKLKLTVQQIRINNRESIQNLDAYNRRMMYE